MEGRKITLFIFISIIIIGIILTVTGVIIKIKNTYSKNNCGDTTCVNKIEPYIQTGNCILICGIVTTSISAIIMIILSTLFFTNRNIDIMSKID